MTPGGDSLFERRTSVRAFLDRPVDKAQVADLLHIARMAPSGANLQPGRFHVLAGRPLAEFSAALTGAEAAGSPHDADYSYFPRPMPAELKALQRAAGFALYAALGIDKRDLDGRRAQFDRNYRFFDAPVGIVVTIRPDMGKGCFMDLGMCLQTFLLAATDAGLGACGIGALANHGRLVHDHLGLGADELVVCGIALGHPDWDHPVNQFRTERLSVEEFATFRGFD
ncbi:nitroreductase [Loktanella sp. IMCC34160]|uniref:nitroreductase n=1 Tax=Loktanella sp. IMCC34160 TaxID=2510646 RepID=UPI00101C7A82|nr:nitroreductase [Loktanella sp. IMCC34160]RYG89715.1 nitroreductase [Loktanella sp. IMCC34160]